MGFDFDPQDQANISAADFAIMCDEMRTLREQADKLAEALRGMTKHGCWHKGLVFVDLADYDAACAAIAEWKQQKGGE